MNLPARSVLPAASATPEGERIERAEPRAGEYWRYRGPGDRDAFRTGDILLVEETAFADGRLHKVQVRAHPRVQGERHHQFMNYLLAEFLDAYEPVDADEAGRAREGEIAGVMAEIDRLRAKLALTGDLEADVRRLGAPQGRLPGPGSGAVVTGAQARQQRQALGKAHARALAAAARIEKGVADIAAKSRELAAYIDEKSAAVSASIAGIRSLAEHYAAGAATLGLFAGDGVEAHLLCDGPQAPPGPLHVMQRLLFMDEEYIVHLSNGGADWKDLGDFGTALATRPGLLESILPFERCAVAMRIRRNEKDYMSGALEKVARLSSVLRAAMGLVEAARQAAEENEANRETFLLVRNGRRVTRIHAALSTTGMTRLYPSQADLRAHFTRRRWRGFGNGDGIEEITLDSLDYTDAVDALERQKTQYRRLVVTMWGVHERDPHVFGPFYDAARHPSWLSVEFQREALRLVRDDEAVLDSGRPSFDEFRRSQNRHLQPGARVLVNWRRALTRSSAPAAFSTALDADDRRILDPVERFSIVRARADDRRTVVDCPCEGEYSWRGGAGRRGQTRKVNVRVELDRVEGEAYLVLDRVEAGDLDWYLANRADREEYLQYWELFETARRRLNAEAARDRWIVDAIAAEIGESGRWPAGDPVRAAAAGLRRWRATAGWRAPSAADLPAVREFAWREIEAGDPAAEREAARAACAREGRVLLRLAASGSRRFVYAAPDAAEEAATRFAAPLDGWVVRIGFDGAKLAAFGRRWLRLPESVAAEAVLVQEPDAAAWCDRRVASIERADVLARISGLVEWRRLLREMFAPLTLDDLRAELKRWHAWRPRSGYVVWPEAYAALGATLVDAADRNGRSTASYALTVELCDLMLLRVARGDRPAAVDLMGSTYRNKAHFNDTMRRLCAGEAGIASWRAISGVRSPSAGWISTAKVSGAPPPAGDDGRVALVHPDAWRFLEAAGIVDAHGREPKGGSTTPARLCRALAAPEFGVGAVLDVPRKGDLA